MYGSNTVTSGWWPESPISPNSTPIIHIGFLSFERFKNSVLQCNIKKSIEKHLQIQKIGRRNQTIYKRFKTMISMTRFQVSLLSACLAFPILLLMKVIGGVDNPIAIFAVGVVSLLVVFLVPRLYFSEGPPKHDPFYNGNDFFENSSL